MSKTRVLIVDDDRNLARLAGMILEGDGAYEVMIVNQSTRAIQAALQFQPHMMLLDVDMPEKGGGDIAHEAAADARLRDIPILFLTGVLSRDEAGTRQLESGGMKFLAKPIEPALLLASVADLIPQSAAA
jgi:two-component system response regulator RstA